MYELFGDQWVKEMSLWKKSDLIEHFEVDGTGLKKLDIINKIRAELIVKRFNESYKVGDKLLWKPIASYGFTPVEVTLKEKAFISNGNPVAFFVERSGYCSIEPKHIRG